VDELTLMWQSAPVRGSQESAVPETWFVPEPDQQIAIGGDGALAVGALPSPSTPRVTGFHGDDAGEVPLERLEARICSLAGRLAASTCEWLRLIAEFDRRKGWAQWGVVSCAHWLSWACSVAVGAAREYVRVATALVRLPLLDAAFASGRLSYSKVRALTRVADRVDEQTLLDQGLVHTASQLERVVRGYRKAEGIGLEQRRRRRARWFWDEDGMLVVSARLTADEGAIVVAALQQAQQEVFVSSRPCAANGEEPPGAEIKVGDLADGSGDCASRDDETDDGEDRDAVSAADALVAMARSALAAGPVDSSGDDQHLVVLHADVGIFADASSSPEDQPGSSGELLCQIENGPGVDRSTAERIACDSAVVAVLHAAKPGELLRLGRKTRKMSAALRRALRIRDGGCQFPGCHRQRHLQAHHVVHWLHGGPTDLDNLVLLCGRHHRAIHEEGFTVSWSADPGDGRTGGGWVFRRPDKVLVPFGGLDQLHRDNPPEDNPAEDNPAEDNPAEPNEPMDPERIRPGWRGERFSLADSVGVLCRAGEHVPT
jgi:hypothetical protein